MNNRLRVLSVDWDYFIQATHDERKELFPDLSIERFAPNVQSLIWSTKYANDRLMEIGCDRDAVKFMTELFDSLSGRDIPIMITDNHKNICRFIYSLYWDGDYQEGVHIMNIGYRHGTYDAADGQSTDNHSWMLELMGEFSETDSIYRWIARKDSDLKLRPGCLMSFTHNIEEALKFKWDAVFICRSSTYTPPHLDRQFLKMIRPFIRSRKCIPIVGGGVMKSRYRITPKKVISEIKRRYYKQKGK